MTANCVTARRDFASIVPPCAANLKNPTVSLCGVFVRNLHGTIRADMVSG
ncbi:MAG TPA: hypothetical protein VGO68_04355 [Pyrinomonadaceae bacterium]|jgi:hypothetical protein|nr:hypothetical protein [Pyrinomonadaceae bacterium]